MNDDYLIPLGKHVLGSSNTWGTDWSDWKYQPQANDLEQGCQIADRVKDKT